VGSQDAAMTASQTEEAKKLLEESLYDEYDHNKPQPPQVAAPAAATKDDATSVGGSEPDPFVGSQASEDGTQLIDDETRDAVAAVTAAAAAAGWKVNSAGAKFFVENEAALNEKGYGSIKDCAEDYAEDEEINTTKKIYKYHLQRLLAAEEETQSQIVPSQDPFGDKVVEQESDGPASEDETDLLGYSALVLSRMKADAHMELTELQARSDPIKLAIDEFVSKYRGLEKNDPVRTQAIEVYKSIKEFAKSPEFDQMSRMEHELRIAVHTAAIEADEYPRKHSALVSHVSDLETAMEVKAVQEVREKAAKAEQKRKASVAGPSSAKKPKGGKE